MRRPYISFFLSALIGGANAAEAQPSVAAEEESRDRAENAYDTAFITFEDEYSAFISMRRFGDQVSGSITTTRNAVPIRGIQRERLSPLEFYEGVGRSDLAVEYQRGRRKQLMVGGLSFGALVASGVLLGVGMSKAGDGYSIDLDCQRYAPTLSDPSWVRYDACRAEEERQQDRENGKATKWFVGAGVAFVGALAFGAIYRHMDPHPVSESERRVLAHDHNERLRRELRLPRRRSVSITPFMAADGGGLMAAGTF